MMATLAGAALAADPPHVTDSSFTEGGERVLQESIVIDTPTACAWKGFTDETTIKTWRWPFIHVDLRSGGTIAQSYDAAARPGGPQVTVQGIITYLPERLLVMRNISAPPGVPGVDAYPRIVQVASLDPLSDNQTLVTISGSGYLAGADFDKLYDYLRQENAAFLVSLKALCENGAQSATPPSATPPA